MRVFRTVLGMLLLTIGLPALLVGAALWAGMQHRDPGGAFSGELQGISTPGYAFVLEDVDSLLRADAPFARIGDTQLRLNARTQDGPAFVGLAPVGEVQRYLAGVPHSTVRSVDIGTGALPVATTVVGGSAVPAIFPGRASFWTRTDVDGSLSWSPGKVTGGPYSLVVMNPGAKAGLRLTATAELRPAWLNSSTWGLLTLGTLLVMIGLIILVWPARRREVIYVVEPSQVPELMAAIGAPLPLRMVNGRRVGAHRPRTLAEAQKSRPADSDWPPANAPAALPAQVGASALPPSPQEYAAATAIPATAGKRTESLFAGSVLEHSSARGDSSVDSALADEMVGAGAVPGVDARAGAAAPSKPSLDSDVTQGIVPAAGAGVTARVDEQKPAPGEPLNFFGKKAATPSSLAPSSPAPSSPAPSSPAPSSSSSSSGEPPAADGILGRRSGRRRAPESADLPMFQASAVGAWVAETAPERARETEARAARRMAEAARRRGLTEGADEGAAPAAAAPSLSASSSSSASAAADALAAAADQAVAASAAASAAADAPSVGAAVVPSAPAVVPSGPAVVPSAPAVVPSGPAVVPSAPAAAVPSATSAPVAQSAARSAPAEVTSMDATAAAYAAGAADARAIRSEDQSGAGVAADRMPAGFLPEVMRDPRLAEQRVSVITGPKATDWMATGLTRADSPRAGGPAPVPGAPAPSASASPSVPSPSGSGKTADPAPSAGTPTVAVPAPAGSALGSARPATAGPAGRAIPPASGSAAAQVAKIAGSAGPSGSTPAGPDRPAASAAAAGAAAAGAAAPVAVGAAAPPVSGASAAAGASRAASLGGSPAGDRPAVDQRPGTAPAGGAAVPASGGTRAEEPNPGASASSSAPRPAFPGGTASADKAADAGSAATAAGRSALSDASGAAQTALRSAVPPTASDGRPTTGAGAELGGEGRRPAPAPGPAALSGAAGGAATGELATAATGANQPGRGPAAQTGETPGADEPKPTANTTHQRAGKPQPDDRSKLGADAKPGTGTQPSTGAKSSAHAKPSVVGSPASVAGSTSSVAGSTPGVAGSTSSVAGSTPGVAGSTSSVAGSTASVAGSTPSVAGSTASVAGSTPSVAGSKPGPEASKPSVGETAPGLRDRSEALSGRERFALGGKKTEGTSYQNRVANAIGNSDEATASQERSAPATDETTEAAAGRDLAGRPATADRVDALGVRASEPIGAGPDEGTAEAGQQRTGSGPAESTTTAPAPPRP
ncbi:MAG TPA: hypothetical protein VGB74_13190, partial [Actinoplanes sp.]